MTLKNFRLDGRVALITGGSKGIGAASAMAFAEAGADVIISARNADSLNAFVPEIEKLGRRAAAIPCDVTKEEDLRALAEKSADALGSPPTILVNNAGGGGPNDPRSEDVANIEGQFRFNVAAPYLLTALLAPTMEKAGGGSVVNISSQAGVIAQKGFSAYGTAKAALIQMTRNLAHDYAPHIRVNAVAPGAVLTDALAPYLTDEAKAAMIAKTPLGRIAEADDVASAVLYLASPASSFMTGRTLVLDGGAEWTTWPY